MVILQQPLTDVQQRPVSLQQGQPLGVPLFYCRPTLKPERSLTTVVVLLQQPLTVAQQRSVSLQQEQPLGVSSLQSSSSLQGPQIVSLPLQQVCTCLWTRPVAHLFWEQEVVGSIPATLKNVFLCFLGTPWISLRCT